MRRYRSTMIIEGQTTDDGRRVRRGSTIWPDDRTLPVTMQSGYEYRKVGEMTRIRRRPLGQIIVDFETPLLLDLRTLRLCADFIHVKVGTQHFSPFRSERLLINGTLGGATLVHGPCAHSRWGRLRRIS